MEYLLSCGCGRKIPVSRSQAGQELKCECGESLQIPTLRGFASLPVAPAQTLSSNPYASSFPAEEEKGVWGGWRGTIMAISVAMFAITFLPCAYHLILRAQINTSFDMDDEIQAGNEAYEAAPLENLVAEWSNFERSGLGPKNKPEFYWWKIRARELEIVAGITGTAAALFAFTAVGMWFSANKGRKRVATSA